MSSPPKITEAEKTALLAPYQDDDTNIVLSWPEYTISDQDITVRAIYTYQGNLNLTPVDTDEDGITDYYRVDAARDLKGSVTVPGNVGGIPVSLVQDLCYGSNIGNINRDLTEVKFEHGVEEINSKALAYTRYLNSVYLPNSVKKIGSNAFGSTIGALIEKRVTITFNGTMAEWKAIEKPDDWARGLESGSTIICTDGSATLKVYESLIFGYDYTWTWSDGTTSK